MLEGRQRKILWGAAAVSLLLVAVSAADREGFRRYFSLRQDIERLTRENADLSARNASLVREISALHKDPAALERAAREELSWIREGEVVIKLEGE